MLLVHLLVRIRILLRVEWTRRLVGRGYAMVLDWSFLPRMDFPPCSPKGVDARIVRYCDAHLAVQILRICSADCLFWVDACCVHDYERVSVLPGLKPRYLRYRKLEVYPFFGEVDWLPWKQLVSLTSLRSGQAPV